MHYGAGVIGASGSYNKSLASVDVDSLRSGGNGLGGGVDILSNSDKSSSTNNDQSRRVSLMVLNHISQSADRDYIKCKKMEKIMQKLESGKHPVSDRAM